VLIKKKGTELWLLAKNTTILRQIKKQLFKTKTTNMKKLLFVVAIVAISVSVNAQKKKSTTSDSKMSFSLGVEAALPIGDFGDFYSFGIGGSVEGQYHASQNVGITLNAGYIDYIGKTVDFSGFSVKYPSSGVVPVMAGVRYTFTGGPYIHGQIGGAFGTQTGAGTSLAYAGGIGYDFVKAIGAEVKYQAYSKNSATSGSVGLRLYYTFGK
jgi:hypothetical protein